MALDTATTNFGNWDYKKYHVEQDLEGANFVSGATVLICATHPRLSQISNPTGAGAAYPLGVVASMGVQQNKQLQRIFEIGSYRSYFVPGRTLGALSIARMYFHGPSLLRALYHLRSGHPDAKEAGANEMYINVAANLFNRPIGLLTFMKDLDGKNVAGMLFEDCYIQAHSWNVGAEQIVISENVQFQFDRAVPVTI